MSAAPAYSSYQYMRVTSPAEYVAHVEINNPKRLNAFSQAVWLEFGKVFDQISADPDFRVAILSGTGDRAFTSGLDVKSAASDSPLSSGEGDEVRKAKLLRSHIEEFQTSISAMEKCEKREFSTAPRPPPASSSFLGSPVFERSLAKRRGCFC